MLGRLQPIITAALTSAVILASLTGCTPEPETELMNLEEAKAFTNSVETEMGEFVPQEIVTLTEQHTESPVLFDCSEGYVWPGLLRLELSEVPDLKAVASAIAAHWHNQEGWTVEEEVSESGTPTVSVSGEGGSLFSATFREQGREFRVTSFSPCFDLGATVDPGKIY